MISDNKIDQIKERYNYKNGGVSQSISLLVHQAKEANRLRDLLQRLHDFPDETGSAEEQIKLYEEVEIALGRRKEEEQNGI